MSQAYNSKYYIDIFKFLLEKKLKKSQDQSFFSLNETLVPHVIFPKGSSRKLTKSRYLQPINHGDNLQNKLNEIEIVQNEIMNIRKTKARLYNESVYQKMLLMKKKKEKDLLEKKLFIENQRISRQKKFEIALQKSQRELSEKIKKSTLKREENFHRAHSTRIRNEALLQEKIREFIEY